MNFLNFWTISALEFFTTNHVGEPTLFAQTCRVVMCHIYSRGFFLQILLQDLSMVTVMVMRVKVPHQEEEDHGKDGDDV